MDSVCGSTKSTMDGSPTRIPRLSSNGGSPSTTAAIESCRTPLKKRGYHTTIPIATRCPWYIIHTYSIYTYIYILEYKYWAECVQTIVVRLSLPPPLLLSHRKRREHQSGQPFPVRSQRRLHLPLAPVQLPPAPPRKLPHEHQDRSRRLPLQVRRTHAGHGEAEGRVQLRRPQQGRGAEEQEAEEELKVRAYLLRDFPRSGGGLLCADRPAKRGCVGGESRGA